MPESRSLRGSQPALDRAAEDLTRRGSPDAFGLTADITDAEQVDAVFSELAQRWNGELNVLYRRQGKDHERLQNLPLLLGRERTSTSMAAQTSPDVGRREARRECTMATGKDARAWARSALRGIGDSLYTPFCGTDGDDIDWGAYRALVRYCVSDLGHPMLWCTSGIGEFWSLTSDERRSLLEIAVEEARAANPDVVVQACTAAMSAKDCLDLTLHAQQAGADIAYIQTPMMETHGGEGVLRFFSYIADRTDIALGMFNSPSSGYILSAEESARIYREVPAVCATKEGAFRPANSRLLHELAPDLVVWECDKTVYRAGWLRAGIVCPAQLGTAGYLFETPQRRLLTEYWELIVNDKLVEAMDYGRESGLDQFDVDLGSWFTCYPGRADYFTHWGGAFKFAASVLGLPVGEYPHSRPPQAKLPDPAKAQIETAYRRLGFLDL